MSRAGVIAAAAKGAGVESDKVGRSVRVRRRLRIVAAGAALVIAATSAAGVPASPAAVKTPAPPTGQALFGVYPGRNPGHAVNAWSGPDLVTYLQAMNRWQGRPNGIVNAFGLIADTNNTFLNYFPTIWNDHRAVPMYSIVSNDYTNQEILDGAQDSDLDRFRTELATWIHGNDVRGVPAPPGGRRIYLRLLFEANTSHLYTNYSPAANAANCDELLAEERKYVATWRYMHDRVMQPGLFAEDQVQWVFSVLHEDYLWEHLRDCPNGASDVTGNIFPGDDVVDWLGIDGFTIDQVGAPDDRTPEQVFAPMAAKLRSLSTKPLSFNEVGTSSTADTNLVMRTAAQKDQWLKDYFAFMQANDVKMSVWNNIVHTPVDWAIFTPDDGEALTGETPVGSYDYMQSRGTDRYTDTELPVTYNVYKEYKAGVNLPWFTAPDATNARLVSNEAFLGTWSTSSKRKPKG